VDRRSSALVLLLIFVVCTIVAIVISGSRSDLQGIAPTVFQYIGYVSALIGGLLLLAPNRSAGAEGGPDGSLRKSGAVVLAAVVLLVLVDVFVLSDEGPDFGGGAVRLVGLVAVVAVTVRLAVATLSARGRRP
jgi:peptidoglycan/LPS O-acetylase OafA/YrhL